MKDNSSHVARPGHYANSSSPSQRWTPFLADDEKRGFQQLEVKSEVIDINMSSDYLNFGVILDSPVDHSFVNPPLPTGLQRYHSAPSSLLHSLSSLIEEDASFPQVSGPLANSSNRTSNSFLSPGFFSHGLTVIKEQMDTEKVATTAGTNLESEFDHYMCNASNFGKRAAVSAAMIQQHSGKSEAAANWQVPNDVFVTDPFESFFSSPKSSSVPSAQLTDSAAAAARQDVDETCSPSSMGVHSMMSSEESISGISEDTSYGHGSLKAPITFSRDDSFLLNDTLTSLNLPTSPGDVSGKRYCGIQSGVAKVMSCETHLEEGPMRSKPGVARSSLKRHMSLPVAKTQSKSGLKSEEVSFAESVLYGTRAKRGCATHPRSIAERVRRTQISERMKKLQQVVPYMDKQTNTSEMLDEAVEYVKSLQKKVQELANTVAELRAQNH